MTICRFFLRVAGLGCVWLASSVTAGLVDPEIIVARGDANHSGSVDISDSIYVADFLFLGGPAPPCKNEADVNHDGEIDVTDVIYLNNFLFLGGPELPKPGAYGARCTRSEAPVIGCDVDCTLVESE